jgi:hypothetical protein
MLSSVVRTPKVRASAPAVALRDVQKVYGRGEGAVVALDGEEGSPDGRRGKQRQTEHGRHERAEDQPADHAAPGSPG